MYPHNFPKGNAFAIMSFSWIFESLGGQILMHTPVQGSREGSLGEDCQRLGQLLKREFTKGHWERDSHPVLTSGRVEERGNGFHQEWEGSAERLVQRAEMNFNKGLSLDNILDKRDSMKNAQWWQVIKCLDNRFLLGCYRADLLFGHFLWINIFLKCMSLFPDLNARPLQVGTPYSIKTPLSKHVSD